MIACNPFASERLVLRDGADAPPQDEAKQHWSSSKLAPRTPVLILRSPPKAGVSKDGRGENLKRHSLVE
ncbi:hypothetical protein D6B98_02565 [Bradyrhizobium sp. LVM 105]|nr:hypothetical protein D6B98_02565 [Bradyrhizobium sp. LVM 105]